ncbi:MAG: hypothetical protein GY894_00355 [Planctomycetes bacterium]|nr:hypothetical protein [Planctomycetota bacterium]MCP4837799.1 hypothetical protein [Planctomycetota bacterium]
MAGEQQSDYSGLSDAVLAPQNQGSVPQWVAVVSIVIGCLGILCWGGQGLISVTVESVLEMPQNLPEQSAGHQAFEVSGYIAGTVLGLWLIVAGFGAVTEASWGRGGLRLWAITRIVLAIIGALGAINWLDESVAMQYQTLQAESLQDGETAAAVPFSEEAIRVFTIGAIAVTTVAVCIWPILVLVVTRRREGA